MITNLQQIINATLNRDSSDVQKLSRWIRCLFNLALTSNVETAEQLLDQVAAIAKNAKQVRCVLRPDLLATDNIDSNQ